MGQTYLFSKYLLRFQYTEQALLRVLEIRQRAKETKDPLNSWTLCSDNLITMKDIRRMLWGEKKVEQGEGIRIEREN